MKLKLFLSLALTLTFCTVLCSCGEANTYNTPSDHACIECGKTATHYMGGQFNYDSYNYNVEDMYYCDSCYNIVMYEAEKNNRVVDIDDVY